MPGSFTLDIAKIRDRARQKMGQGAVTDSYGKDPADVIGVLNEVLATEIVCWMRYSRHAISVTGINRAQVAGAFTDHAEEERDHAMRVAGRISQLGGEPGRGAVVPAPLRWRHVAYPCQSRKGANDGHR